MSPQLRSVTAAGEVASARGAHPWTTSADDWFGPVEELRARFAQLVGANSDGVAFIPATSYGLATAARNLPAEPRDRVLVLDGEYSSNYFTWRRFAERTGAELAVVTREPGQSWTEAVL